MPECSQQIEHTRRFSNTDHEVENLMTRPVDILEMTRWLLLRKSYTTCGSTSQIEDSH